jgi:hypothetical protein
MGADSILVKNGKQYYRMIPKKLFLVVNVDYFFLSHRKEIALESQKRGFDVTVVAKNTGKREEIESLGLKYIDLPMSRSSKNIFKEFWTFLFLFFLYIREKPSIVHHVGLKTILYGTIAAKLARINNVVNAVSGLGILFSSDNNSVLSRTVIYFLRFSHNQKHLAVIFQNEADRALFLNNNILKENQAFKIKGSGIDLNLFSYVPEQ